MFDVFGAAEPLAGQTGYHPMLAAVAIGATE